jgi:hypothetical protein
MSKVPAYHSKREDFYHDNSQCGLAVRIPLHNRVQGTGQKPLCKNCEKLHDEEVNENRLQLALAFDSVMPQIS